MRYYTDSVRNGPPVTRCVPATRWSYDVYVPQETTMMQTERTNCRLLVCALLLMLGGCASNDKGPSSYDELYGHAQSATALAKRMGFLWSDTERLLQESARASYRGDKKTAKRLAREALEQAQLAQQQAQQQADPQVRYPVD